MEALANLVILLCLTTLSNSAYQGTSALQEMGIPCNLFHKIHFQFFQQLIGLVALKSQGTGVAQEVEVFLTVYIR
uniref:Uncharacterized protein n=1 Tax=Arundo donax TaxID=35708 RepID=A0A0A8ZEU6_ARUDO